MAEAVKFIHASDFHLDQSMRGLAELPTHLKTVLANAPYDAAEKVFDLAIAERVDFVLLTGDLYDMDKAGPRSPAFLLSQFNRLAEKDIYVYWCAGSVDQPDRWPGSIELPENVVTFSSSLVEEVEHRRNGKSSSAIVATILGSGYDPQRKSAADFSAALDGPFAIACSYGEFDSNSMAGQNIRYWALGGRHRANKLEKSGSVLSYPGTTQGRSPKESGVHGCKLCRVDSTGKLRVQTIETDTVRWLPQKISINEYVQKDELKKALGERGLKIATDTPQQTVLVNWFLATDGEFNPKLRRPEWAAEILEWLRDEFGRGETGVWSVNVTVEPPKNLPSSWYEEDTILGEYLRAVGRYQSDDSLKLSLHNYLPNSVEGDSMSGIARVIAERREEVLRKTALVGVEYLAVNRESRQTDIAEV